MKKVKLNKQPMSVAEASYEIVAKEIIKQGSRPDHFSISDLVVACLELIEADPSGVKHYAKKHS